MPVNKDVARWRGGRLEFPAFGRLILFMRAWRFAQVISAPVNAWGVEIFAQQGSAA